MLFTAMSPVRGVPSAANHRTYTPFAILAGVFPSDHEVPIGRHRHETECLIASRRHVDRQLGPQRDTCRIVSLGVNTPTTSILAHAAPSDHEVASRVHRYRTVRLDTGSVGIDTELAPKGISCRVILPPKQPSLSPAPFPNHVTTKCPSAAIAAPGPYWSPVVVVFARNASVSGFPAASYRRP